MIEQLQRAVDELRAREAQLHQQEQALAQWCEQLTESERVQQAEHLGRDEERRRVLLLIQEQLSYIEPRSNTSLVLRRLSDLVGA